MKINWKLRLKNKATLVALAVVIISFVYNIFAILEIVPSLSEDTVTTFVTMVIDLLAMMGIVIDPTTSGITDSDQAMTYSAPK